MESLFSDSNFNQAAWMPPCWLLPLLLLLLWPVASGSGSLHSDRRFQSEARSQTSAFSRPQNAAFLWRNGQKGNNCWLFSVECASVLTDPTFYSPKHRTEGDRRRRRREETSGKSPAQDRCTWECVISHSNTTLLLSACSVWVCRSDVSLSFTTEHFESRQRGVCFSSGFPQSRTTKQTALRAQETQSGW